MPWAFWRTAVRERADTPRRERLFELMDEGRGSAS
jgi:hypothetical protein